MLGLFEMILALFAPEMLEALLKVEGVFAIILRLFGVNV